MGSTRFENAISALVKAFFDGSLRKGDCTACAVGNITGTASWANVFVTAIGSKKQVWYGDMVAQAYGGIDHIESMCLNSSGYSLKELAKVEFAFESNTKLFPTCAFSHDLIMQDQYNGLMAVVDVLCKIEGIESAEYKKMFEYSV